MIEASRGAGYYVNQGESLEGLTTISAPFYWQHSLYIVTIAAPSSRLDDRIAEAASRLLEMCSRLEMKGR
jgi:DNA-binding IclR family transcriptional regulator